MRSIFWVAILVGAGHQQFVNGTPSNAAWKTFKSDQGYELKVPECWSPIIGDAYENGAVTAVEDICFTESSTCKRPPNDPEIPNGICVHSGKKFKSVTGKQQEVDRIEHYVQRGVDQKENLVLKRYKIGSGEAITYVRRMPSNPNEIQWLSSFYCTDRSFEFTILTIKDPEKQYFERFEKGELALPEPEKTVMESIKCVAPKAAPGGTK